MSGFAALMALSASQTKESQNSVQAALAQRQRKEEEKQKQQAAFERKEKEREATLRKKHLEDQKRQEESKVRREQEAAAKQRVREKREEEERHKLLYGPKKSKSDYPTSTSNTRDEVRKRRLPDDDDEMGGANALTREEKRRRKEDAELRRAMAYGKSASHKAGRTHRVGGKLAGGALDIISAQGGDGGSGTSSQSIKARISAAPNTLTRLNIVKRDTRTIDEILTDRAKLREANVLDGDNAREFNNWFGDKKKEPAPKSTAVSTPSPGSSTPVNSNPSTSKSNGASSALNPKKYMIPNSASAAASSSRPIPQKVANKPLKPAASGSKGGATSKATSSARPAPQSRKRTRSASLSDDSDSYGSPPKRRPPPSSHPSVGEEIWKMFGKDRSQYVERDVFSDDEDMEADATAMEMEEYRSARMAKKEDEAALAEENRREQEKRRKKKEKEMRERRA